MIIAGIIFSVVAVFLGAVTKLPQGGGGLVNNLMVMTFLLSPPPMLPVPPPKATIFDLDAAIRENQLYYMRNPVVTGNVTLGPMPRPFETPRTAANSSNATAPEAGFALPTFSLLTSPIALQLFQFWLALGEAIGIIAMVFITLCLPWLVIKQMHLLEKTGTAPKAASKPIGIVLGEQMPQIQPHNPLFDELQMAISERNQALTEFEIFEKQAKEEVEEAAKRDNEKDETLKALQIERDDALVEVVRGKGNLEELRSKMEGEAEELKKGVINQEKAWQERERKWKEERAEEMKRNQEDIDGLMMRREQETESWTREVRDLEAEKGGIKEALGIKLRITSERMKKEREGWAKEKEWWEKEKESDIAEREKMGAEQKELEGKWTEEKKLLEEENGCAQRRIVELEEETERLKAEAAERDKKSKELEAARKAAEEENKRKRKRSEEEALKEAKKVVSALEEEVLNGRKLIEDLQSDKRRDRQLLLELRAQLVRPTHAAPPTHINPLRFGGPYRAAIRGPAIPPISGPPPSTSIPPATALRGTFPPIPPTTTRPLPSQASPPAGHVGQDVDELIAPLPRPVVRLPPSPPPRGQMNPAQATGLPPPNAPKGPRR